MNELSLFTGAGGGLLGTHLLGWRAIGYVENNDYCQRVIRQRVLDGILPNAPIFGPIETFLNEGYAESIQGMVDVVSGGFPCQPFSVAGQRKGEADDRNLWPACIDTICKVRPRFAFLENVPGLLAIRGKDNLPYYGRILGDLAESGYDIKWRCLSAAEVGAPHKRDRLWIVAYSNNSAPTRQREYGREGLSITESIRSCKSRQDVADSEQSGLQVGKLLTEISGKEGQRDAGQTLNLGGKAWWATDPADLEDSMQQGSPPEYSRGKTNKGGEIGISGKPSEHGQEPRPVESRLGRVAYGVAHRVDRLKAIGNGQVPAVVAAVWRLLNESGD